jgi:hypothetical protein
MDYLLQNWDTISLVITNVLALFVNKPRISKKTRRTD